MLRLPMPEREMRIGRGELQERDAPDDIGTVRSLETCQDMDEVEPGKSSLSPSTPKLDKLEKLCRGMTKLDTALHCIQKSIDNLPEVLRSSNGSNVHHKPPTGSVGSGGPHRPMDRIGSGSAMVNMSTTGEEHGMAAWSLPMEESQVKRTSHNSTSSEVPAGGSLRNSPIQEALQAEGSAADFLGLRKSRNYAGGSPVRYLLSTQGSRSFTDMLPNRPHDVFQDLARAMERTEYAHVKEWANLPNLVAHGSSLSSAGSKVARASTAMSTGPWRVNFPMHPTSTVRTTFDCLSTLVLGIDAIWVPLVMAFNLAQDGALNLLSWSVTVFWTLDMIMNFSTGYSDGTHVVLRWRLVARHYLRGTFSIDLIILLIDYAELVARAVADGGLSDSSLQIIRLLRFGKVTRLVRVVAKMRLGLLARVDNMVSYWLHVHGLVGYAHYMSFVVILLKLICFIAWLSHFGSCLWFFLERNLTSDDELSWWNRLREDHGLSSDSDFYVHGIYWSVTTMFSGASHISPTNTMEFIFAGISVVVGTLFLTSITSTLAVILIESQEGQQERKKKVRALTKFMEQHKTPVLLALAIRTDLVEKISAERRLTELDLPFLATVNPGLRAALREAMYSHHFLMMPLFRVLSVLRDGFIQDLAFSATTFGVTQPREELFNVGKAVQCAILLAKGQLQYTDHSVHSHNSSTGHKGVTLGMSRIDSQTSTGLAMSAIVAVEPGAWISEMALLLQWKTAGQLESEQGTCEVLHVAVDGFIKAVSSYPAMAAVTSAYASHVCKVYEESDLMAPNDLDPRVDCDAVVANVHFTIREVLSMPVLDIVRRHAFLGMLRRKTLLDLELEVRDGRCHLVMGPSGEICRTVRLAVLRLMNKEGQICVKLAEYRNGACRPKFQLPGRKVDRNESPEDTIARVWDEEFRGLAGFMQHDTLETFIEDEESASFGLRTKYIKTVQNAILEAAICMEGSDVRAPQSSAPMSLMGNLVMRSITSWRDSPWPSMQHTSAQSCNSVSGLNLDALDPSDFIEVGTKSMRINTKSAFALQVQDGLVNIYAFLDVADYERMFARRDLVEMSMSQWCSSLHASHMRRLGSWTMRRDSSASDDLHHHPQLEEEEAEILPFDC
mmetsp:Transcript_33878/g.79213  ORF Transcript_33878/g.79213 Transcript_33878/m.79213 type:complete len:1120 (-) Transcript_33878:55-3414(-)